MGRFKQIGGNVGQGRQGGREGRLTKMKDLVKSIVLCKPVLWGVFVVVFLVKKSKERGNLNG